jgi:hypothetical protein
LKTFVFAVAALLSMQAHAAHSDADLMANPAPVMAREADLSDDEEEARASACRAASAEGNEEGVLRNCNPAELTDALANMGVNEAEGEALILPPGGEKSAQYNVRIDAYISQWRTARQYLKMVYQENGVRKEFSTPTSSGARTRSGGTMSDILVGKCFSVHGQATRAATMTNAIFFRGKRGTRDKAAIPGAFTYAIHGLTSSGYQSLLGTPASHGCLRVSQEAAKFIRATSMRNGTSRTVVCVH